MRSIFREPARSFVRGFEAGLWDPAFGLENVRFLSARLIFSARLRDFRALREAAKWYALAAESGYAPAQGRLAQLYETGQGVGLDYVLAYSWYAKAVAGGHEASRQAMALLSQRMTSRQLQVALAALLNREHLEERSGGVIVEKKLPAQQWPQK